MDSSIHIFSIASSTVNRLTSLSLFGISEEMAHTQLDTREADWDFLRDDVVDLEACRRDDATILLEQVGEEEEHDDAQSHLDIMRCVLLCFVVFFLLLLATVAAVATATRTAASVTPRGVLSLLKVVILFEFMRIETSAVLRLFIT